MIDAEIRAYYDRGDERDRLFAGGDRLELVRTKELLERFLPRPPATILDVGGGPGAYAAWLAASGYEVHLVDPVPLHVEQAAAAAAAQPDHPFTTAVGDARRLAEGDASVDAVLLLGPLYHLTERADRLTALAEAARVARPGGVVLAVAISRFASLLDGLRLGFLDDPAGVEIVRQDLATGQHRNPDLVGRPAWFTTAFFHHPDELAAEIEEAGLRLDGIFGIEGPGGFVGPGWSESERRDAILLAARAVEGEAATIGMSGHLLAVGRKEKGAP